MKRLAKNEVKNVIVKGMCFSLPYRLGIPCEIAAGSVADMFSERRENKNRKIIVKEVERNGRYRSNVCIGKYSGKREYPIGVMIKSSARKTANRFQNRYLLSEFFAKQSKSSFRKDRKLLESR